MRCHAPAAMRHAQGLDHDHKVQPLHYVHAFAEVSKPKPTKMPMALKDLEPQPSPLQRATLY